MKMICKRLQTFLQHNGPLHLYWRSGFSFCLIRCISVSSFTNVSHNFTLQRFGHNHNHHLNFAKLRSYLYHHLHTSSPSSYHKHDQNLSISVYPTPLIQKKISSPDSMTYSNHYTSSQSTWPPSDRYINPMAFLEPMLQIPLFRPDDQLFQPSKEEMKAGEALFSKAMAHKLKLHKGVVKLEDLPEYNAPEVAFCGRSNVGKSSLINSIFRELPQTRVSISKKPGHTKVLKMYQVGKHFSLVDMPGYGTNMPSYYQESMEVYLQTRQKLARVFFLIDGVEGLTKEDFIAIDMLEEFSKPYVIVMTKIDAASEHHILRNLLAVRKIQEKRMLACFPQPFLVSCTVDSGIAVLQAFIAYVTGNIEVKGC